MLLSNQHSKFSLMKKRRCSKNVNVRKENKNMNRLRNLCSRLVSSATTPQKQLYCCSQLPVCLGLLQTVLGKSRLLSFCPRESKKQRTILNRGLFYFTYDFYIAVSGQICYIVHIPSAKFRLGRRVIWKKTAFIV